MAMDAYIKLPGIEGESPTAGYEKQIQLMSFAWGCTQPASQHYGSGGGVGKADWQDFSFMKMIDKSSPKLQEALAKGTHIKDAKLTVREVGGEEAVEYYTVVFKDVIITSYQTSGSSGSEKMTDSCSFAYSECKVEYQPQDSGGKKEGKVEFGWSQKTGKSA